MRADTPVWAVIPAAGSGSRMQSDTAKPYLAFHGKSILEHCLDRLLSHSEISGAVLVIGARDENWDRLAYASSRPLLTAVGGGERFESVYNGLKTLREREGDDVLALVHDAARPLVRHADLDKVIAAARANASGALLAAPLSDTLKRQDENQAVASTLLRDGLWRALTPQVFQLRALIEALDAVIEGRLTITDDAQAMELAGWSPKLVAGETDNLKITQPGDLELAAAIWSYQRDQQNNE